eukprot:scaffold64_cov338-Pavlova_lutheri.AAC.51
MGARFVTGLLPDEKTKLGGEGRANAPVPRRNAEASEPPSSIHSHGKPRREFFLCSDGVADVFRRARRASEALRGGLRVTGALFHPSVSLLHRSCAVRPRRLHRSLGALQSWRCRCFCRAQPIAQGGAC